MSRQNPILGPAYLLRGYSMLFASGLKRWVIAPLLINIILLILLIGSAIAGFDSLLSGLLPEGWEWLAWLIWPLFVLLCLVLAAASFTVLTNLIAAPFNSRLAEAVVRKHGRTLPQSNASFVSTIPAAVLGELRKLGYALKWILPLLILGLVPVLNLLTPAFWLLFGAWMLAIEYADYPLGNIDMDPADQRAWLAESRARSLGFGGSVMACTIIPVLNFAVIPAAVIGATLMWLENSEPLAVQAQTDATES